LRAANAKAQASHAALNKAPADPAAAYKAHMALYADAKAAEADYEAACRAADGYKKQATPQYMADRFTAYVPEITEVYNRFSCRPDDRDLVRLYALWRPWVKNTRDPIREHFPNSPALPELPSLIGNDYFTWFVNLADFCTEAARRLYVADAKAPAPKPTTVDRAAAYIAEHPGCKSAIVCKEACDGMEIASFISHISPVLRKRGFHVTPGCTAVWYPPEKDAK